MRIERRRGPGTITSTIIRTITRTHTRMHTGMTTITRTGMITITHTGMITITRTITITRRSGRGRIWLAARGRGRCSSSMLPAVSLAT